MDHFMKAKIAALALLTGSALFSTNVFAKTEIIYGPERHIFCHIGKFTGELKFKIGKSRHSTFRYIQTTQYRIKRHNGQGGGNKANINLKTYYSRDEYESKDSPDSMKQEGNWLPYVTGLWAVDPKRYQDSRIVAKFIFDRSGRDQACRAAYSLGPND